MNNNIIPEKIHLHQIQWIENNTVILNRRLKQIPVYNFLISYDVLHNLEQKTIMIQVFVDCWGIVNKKKIKQGGSYQANFIFIIDNLDDQFEVVANKPIFGSVFISTLLAISYSTLRGMFFEIWKDTVLSGVLLPVISIPTLFKNSR